jgi:Flp pilus assembly protein TadG
MKKFSERMATGRSTSLFKKMKGQSMVEFAMILPLFVLFIIGIFELGRAFFAYIAITNAAREGARVVTFWPGKTTIGDVYTAVTEEIGNSPMVTEDKVNEILMQCGSDYDVQYNVDSPTTTVADCPSEEPVRVTVTYNFDLILNFFSTNPIILNRSAEMMVP